jgi:hypothetical protein
VELGEENPNKDFEIKLIKQCGYFELQPANRNGKTVQREECYVTALQHLTEYYFCPIGSLMLP